MNSLLLPLLQTLAILGAVTWTPIHGLPPGSSLWLFGITFAWFVLGFRESARSPLVGIFLLFLLWPLWTTICGLSWPAADLIHHGASLLVDLSGAPFGPSTGAFRIDGVLITPDPMKTASLALLLLLFLRLGRTLVRAGIRSTAADAVFLVPILFVFAILRWFILAPLLTFIRPDLVTWSGALFQGPLLGLSLAPLLMFPCVERPVTQRAGTRPFIAWTFVLLLLMIGKAVPMIHPGPIPRMLIDDSHSKWEPVLPPASVFTHPVLAENNYRPFLLRCMSMASVTVSLADGQEGRDLPGGLKTVSWTALMRDSAALKKYKIILLKCPTREYAEADRERILDWVWAGGRLFVVGEHTDVFFINSHLNDLLAATGLKFGYDAVCSGSGAWVVTGGPLHSPLPWSPGNARFMWATGASLQGPIPMLPLMVSSPDAFADPADRNNSNFFGTMSPDLRTKYGPFPLSTALPFGRGLIIAHGDSTGFNASMLSTPGKSRFLQRIVQGIDFPVDAAPLALIVLICSGILGCQALGCLLRAHAHGFAILALVLQIGFVSDLPGLLLQPSRTGYASVLLDHSLAPSLGLPYGHQEVVTASDSLVPLIVGFENLGFPCATSLEELHESLKGSPGLVILAEPGKAPSIKSLRALQQFVRHGGACLISCRKSLEGISRTIALGLGMAETLPPDPRTGLPTLNLPGARSHLLNSDLGFTRFPIGSGSLFLLEYRENASAVDLGRIAELLSDPLLRR